MPIYTLTLVAKETVARDTVELQFEKPEGFQYVAGQYGGFTLLNPAETDAKGNTRRFSLVSAPHESTLKIVTRIQQSSFKRELNKLEPGSTLKFAGPTGNFVLPTEHQKPVILIAGGIGIAPFYSMNFLNEAYPALTEAEKTTFSELLSQADPDIMAWIMGRELAPTPAFAEISHKIFQHARSRLSS